MWDVREILLNQESSIKATASAVAFIILLIACWSCTCATDIQAFLEIEAKG